MRQVTMVKGGRMKIGGEEKLERGEMEGKLIVYSVQGL